MNAWRGIGGFAIFFASTVFVGLLVWLQRRRDRQMEGAVEQSFRRVSFTSDGVLLTGADLVVVRKVREFMDANYDASFMLERDAMNGSHAFWYCSGPGARWFLAIPSVSVQRGRIDVQWLLRPLTEQRMRAVLRFDRDAYRRAFGEMPD